MVNKFCKRCDESTAHYASGRCKVCEQVANRKPGRIIRNRYHSQIRNSKARGHSSPGYTFKWLVDFCYSNGFEQLHRQYIDSGFDKDLAPSIDRLDDSVGYTKRNIRLTTWKENNDSYCKTKVGLKCERCEVKFYVLPHMKDKTRFCSKSCASSYRGATKRNT